MSKLKADHVFTSESVSEGHPDKVCDQVSDAILDACLSKDAASRVACETAVTTNFMANIGEITCRGWDEVDPEAVARGVIRDIGYDRKELKFCCDDFEYATRTTPSLMPAPIHYSHTLLERLQEVRKSGEIDYLRPDAKIQVSVLHEEGIPKRITSVVVSHQTDDLPLEKICTGLVEVSKDLLSPTGLIDNDTALFPARTPQRWTGPLPTMPGMRPRISLPQGWLRNVRFRWPMPLAWQAP